ncbi:uncharacterized protein LOC131333220 isoform X3 [Rhododendron vialii]|uniref:uncharacterized protein LOC131333220 isoform X3 n=1 Tax=Rhododendron vialii TaxID=182163 RepID=UPI00265ED059|nr:uncharacterized protein LOC131333220 isoform X3 [Rhododendron vialii]
MDRLRPRERKVFSGFTTAEIAKMEKLHRESGEQSLDPVFCKRISKDFNRSKGRVGKPVVKWTEVKRFQIYQSWSLRLNHLKMGHGMTWMRFSPIGFLVQEVRLRFIGFGSEEDEWINVKNAIRVRSLPLEHSECGKVKVGDQVLCFQERRDQAIYYDVHIVEIQRRVHDIRGCRCLFLIRYDHDNTEASSISISCYQTTISFISSSYISSCWLILSSVVTKCLTLILFYHLYFSRREFV